MRDVDIDHLELQNEHPSEKLTVWLKISDQSLGPSSEFQQAKTEKREATNTRGRLFDERLKIDDVLGQVSWLIHFNKRRARHSSRFVPTWQHGCKFPKMAPEVEVSIVFAQVLRVHNKWLIALATSCLPRYVTSYTRRDSNWKLSSWPCELERHVFSSGLHEIGSSGNVASHTFHPRGEVAMLLCSR